ncbi:hypothetical protein CYMTET_41321 [Cymbomonas tetramitiformis]|uniref:Uncharacterized protein n=1 Tax=Cymbomonas tetramitiformis TaxID=36881 RepID=A0AAE0C1Z0_9CHLO|nr:hypothetical protein CYMTET_44653 [Cymbomonas tetramitiformis]KAK3249245.1 hypothetical protein CYMTET_41321 [Cymbomonas tetramitiformis]
MSVSRVSSCTTLSADVCESADASRGCVLLRSLRDSPRGYCRARTRGGRACGICATNSTDLYMHVHEAGRDAAKSLDHVVCGSCVRTRVVNGLLQPFARPEKTTATQADFEDIRYVCPLSGEAIVLSDSVAREILSHDRALGIEMRVLNRLVELKLQERMETVASMIRDGSYDVSHIANNQEVATIDKWFHHFKALRSLVNTIFDTHIQAVDFDVHSHILNCLYDIAASDVSGTRRSFRVNLSEKTSDLGDPGTVSIVHSLLEVEPPSDLKMVPHVQNFMNAGFVYLKYVYTGRFNIKRVSTRRKCSDIFDPPFYVDLIPESFSTLCLGDKVAIELTSALSLDDSSMIHVYSLSIVIKDAVMTRDASNEYVVTNFCRLKLKVQNKSRARSKSGAVVVTTQWSSQTNVELLVGETYVIRLAVDDSRLRRKVKRHDASQKVITMTIPKALDGFPMHVDNDLKIGLHLGSTLRALAPYTWIGRDLAMFGQDRYYEHEKVVGIEAADVAAHLHKPIKLEHGQSLRVLLYDRPPCDARGQNEAPIERVDLLETGTAYVLKHKGVGSIHHPGQRYDRVVIPEDLSVKHVKVQTSIFEDGYMVNTKPKQWYLQVQILHDGRVCLLNNVQRSADGAVYAWAVYTPNTFQASLHLVHDYRFKSENQIAEWRSLSTEIPEIWNRRLRKYEVYNSSKVFENHLDSNKLFTACGDAVYRSTCRTGDRQHTHRAMYVRFVVTSRTG